MTACNRFEVEGLLRLEQGLALDEHFTTCPDCLEAQARYQELEGQIATAATELEPPAEWQARVWAELENRQRSRRPRWQRRWLAPIALAASIAAITLITVPFFRSTPAHLEVRLLSGGGAERRGLEAQPGDRLSLESRAGGAAFAELRVYLNDEELVMRCSSALPCRRRGDALSVTLTLPARGTYQSILLVSAQPLPPPAASFDADVNTAIQAGASYELGEEIRVR